LDQSPIYRFSSEEGFVTGDLEFSTTAFGRVVSSLVAESSESEDFISDPTTSKTLCVESQYELDEDDFEELRDFCIPSLDNGDSTRYEEISSNETTTPEKLSLSTLEIMSQFDTNSGLNPDGSMISTSIAEMINEEMDIYQSTSFKKESKEVHIYPNIFALVCDTSNEREYPWGILSIDNPKHSDFRRLQMLLFENGKCFDIYIYKFTYMW
jgi:hypothetical protein